LKYAGGWVGYAIIGDRELNFPAFNAVRILMVNKGPAGAVHFEAEFFAGRMAPIDPNSSACSERP
jgi:hypothetical protein